MVTTPLEMPSPLPVNAKEFDLGYIQDVSPIGAGFIQAIDRAPAMWVARYATPPLTPARDQVFLDFLDRLRGASGCFLGFDPRRPRPYVAMGVGGSPWAQVVGVQPQVIAASFTSSQLELSGVATGFTFSNGDYVAYQRGNAWYLHRVVSGPYVTDSSHVVTLNVVPRPLDSTTAVGCRLNRPPAAMKLIGKIDKKDKVDDIGPTYAFTAAQFIDRSTS